MDFDDYTETYEAEVRRAIAFSGASHDVFVRSKVRHLTATLSRDLGEPRLLRVLDVGCGVGLAARWLKRHVASLTGVDPSLASVVAARKAHPDVAFAASDGCQLPFADRVFDVVVAMNVLHHVPPRDRQRFVAEMARVCRHGGDVVVFEHNRLHPLTRWVVRRCPFDHDAVLLSRREVHGLVAASNLEVLSSRYIIVFPSEARIARLAEAAVARLPLGTQYLVAARRPDHGR